MNTLKTELKKLTGIGMGSILCFSIFSCKSSESEKEEKPANILFITMEDFSPHLGCYGESYIQSPNIDELANQGILFNRAYCGHPVSAASRASFLTGLRPQTTGVDYPYSYYFVEEVLSKYNTIQEFFHGRGYYTRNFGKVHHHGMDIDTLSAPPYHPRAHIYFNPRHREISEEKGRHGGLPPFEKSKVAEDSFADAKTAKEVVNSIKNASQKKSPFCFTVGFKKCHLPFTAPAKYWELYERENIPLAQNRSRPHDYPDIAFNRYNLKFYEWEHKKPDSLFSKAYSRKLRHAYFANISFVDAQVGRIMEALEKENLMENTIIILTADHGYHIGELNHWGKTTLYEESLQVPLIVAGEGIKNKGKSTDGLVELVDLMPTMIDLAGYEIPEHLEGTSMTPLIENPGREWKKAVFSTQNRGILGMRNGHSIRTDRYRYTEWRNDLTGEIMARELYDLKEDPHETKNLAGDQTHSQLVSRLSAQMDKGWKAALPEGIQNESDNPLAPPPYAWAYGDSRRETWIERYGGNEGDNWRELTRQRLKKEKKQYGEEMTNYWKEMIKDQLKILEKEKVNN
jgi:arylsulfatase A-like enzyme